MKVGMQIKNQVSTRADCPRKRIPPRYSGAGANPILQRTAPGSLNFKVDRNQCPHTRLPGKSGLPLDTRSEHGERYCVPSAQRAGVHPRLPPHDC